MLRCWRLRRFPAQSIRVLLQDHHLLGLVQFQTQLLIVSNTSALLYFSPVCLAYPLISFLTTCINTVQISPILFPVPQITKSSIPIPVSFNILTDSPVTCTCYTLFKFLILTNINHFHFQYLLQQTSMNNICSVVYRDRVHGFLAMKCPQAALTVISAWHGQSSMCLHLHSICGLCNSQVANTRHTLLTTVSLISSSIQNIVERYLGNMLNKYLK